MISTTHHHRPLPSRRDFLWNLGRRWLVSAGLILGSLGLGVIGYRYFADLPWIDSLLNASMILTGMGPVDTLKTSGAKVFASLYALFSGVAFLTIIAVMLAPLTQRFLHRFHLELEEGKEAPPSPSAPRRAGQATKSR